MNTEHVRPRITRSLLIQCMGPRRGDYARVERNLCTSAGGLTLASAREIVRELDQLSRYDNERSGVTDARTCVSWLMVMRLPFCGHVVNAFNPLARCVSPDWHRCCGSGIYCDAPNRWCCVVVIESYPMCGTAPSQEWG